MNVLLDLLYILIFPGLLFASLAGLILSGIDRKLLARMQHRIGPPVVQPFYDFFKLCGKETIVPSAANKAVFLGAPIAGLASLCVLAAFIPVFGFAPFSGNADLIIILYLLTIPAVCLIVGGASSGSPFAGVGISREMVTMIAYEFPLILVFLSIAKVVGGDHLSFSLGEIMNWQQAGSCAIAHWSLIPAAIAFLLIIPAEVGSSPFDVAEAETEICEGPLIEYSGAPLAVFKLNTSIKMFIMSALFVNLFFGGIHTGFLWLDAIILIVLCILVTVICITLIHAVTARLKVEHLFKFYWTIVAGLALISLILVWIGL